MTKFKKQIIFAVITVVLATALGILYAFLSRPDTEEEKEIEYGDFGEIMENGRPYIMPKVENENMNSIFVHNEYDEYTLIHKLSGAYKIEGLEGYEIDQSKLSYLRVNALNLKAVSYVENADMDNVDQYGINLSDPKIYFEVFYDDKLTDTEKSYKILIGDKTPDGIGYYAMLEGREALYVVDNGLENAILLPRRAYVTPKFVDKVEPNYNYTINSFLMNKKGQKFIEIEKHSGDLTYGNNGTHRITYPAYYSATSLNYFDALLTSLNSLTGTETLYYGDGITNELLQALGFFDADGRDTSDYSLVYSYPNFTEYLYILKNEDTDDYTVYSMQENIIVRVDKTNLEFLDWDMLLWVSAEIFLLDIEDVASVDFLYKGISARFDIRGSGDELTVEGNGLPIDTKKFKELYKSLFYILVTAYTEDSNYGGEQMRFTVTTEKGETLEYVFYLHSATNSYYTLNGFGEFYVSADKVREVGETAIGLITVN